MWETPESHQLETLNPKRPTEKEQQPPTPAFHQHVPNAPWPPPSPYQSWSPRGFDFFTKLYFHLDTFGTF